MFIPGKCRQHCVQQRSWFHRLLITMNNSCRSAQVEPILSKALSPVKPPVQCSTVRLITAVFSLLSALISSFSTYQALVDDVLDHRLNRVTVQMDGKNGQGKRSKTYDVDAENVREDTGV